MHLTAMTFGIHWGTGSSRRACFCYSHVAWDALIVQTTCVRLWPSWPYSSKNAWPKYDKTCQNQQGIAAQGLITLTAAMPSFEYGQ